MWSDKLQLISIIFAFLPRYAVRRVRQKLNAAIRRLRYHRSANPKNIVVIGGSFAGARLVSRLLEVLPDDHRVVLIEQNSHLNWSWVFPRFSVVPGHENYAFVPYTGLGKKASAGSFRHMQARATEINETSVTLDSGEQVLYEYLAIATGSTQPIPGKVTAVDAFTGAAELRGMQVEIKNAPKIAVVGGGAVGVEVAADIQSFHPDKKVTMYQSRAQLLPSYGTRLHEHVTQILTGMGMDIVLNERPQVASDGKSLKTSTGVHNYDLIIQCTGQKPNSAILATFAPDAISSDTKRILVNPSLEIIGASNSAGNIFALGDVAETGAPKMARAGVEQAETVVENIQAKIKGSEARSVYRVNRFVEGSIKLTLGKDKFVLYADEDKGRNMMLQGKGLSEDLDISRAWWHMGLKMKRAYQWPPVKA